MFVYLSKKIAVPGNIQISALAWSTDQGFIGVGGDKGLLKILQLADGKTEGQAAGGLSINENLEVHTHNTHIVVWNNQYKKLTTADENGLIIVWMHNNKEWVEEMINNRNKSHVVDMKWSPDGSKICIVYYDGAVKFLKRYLKVILGGVEGNRVWGKDFKYKLQILEWSPDSKFIVFGTHDGQVHIYDCEGKDIHQVKVYCLSQSNDIDQQKPNLALAAIQWFENSKMYTEDTPPGLIIAYKCGRYFYISQFLRLQLMKNDYDEDPVLIDTTLDITGIRWNPSGTIFSVCGSQMEENTAKGIVQFYNNMGQHLKSLKVPGSDIVRSITWEQTGLRVAMAVGSVIFFANIRPNHQWTFMDNVLVFGYQKSNRIENCVVFWDTKANTKNLKYVKNLIWIKSAGDYCCIISKAEDNDDCYQILLCNNIGASIDQKIIDIEPLSCTMSGTHVVVACHDNVYCWQYKNQNSRITSFSESLKNQTQENVLGRRIGREIAWFIEDTPSQNQIYDKDHFQKVKNTEDIITSISATETCLLVARRSGTINKYSLPHIHLENKQSFRGSPASIYINSDSTRAASIDINGYLTVYELNAQGGTQLQFEKKDVWFVEWAKDAPLNFAYMEKYRLYTVQDLELEEPIMTESYICSYNNLQIKCAFIDDIMKSPDGNLKASQFIKDFDTKTLRDTNDILEKVSISEAFAFVEQNPHPRLWRLLIEKSLEELDFAIAEKALIKIGDYISLQMVKKIQLIDDKTKQKAEILAYHGKADQAEALLKKIERKDLVIQLRSRLGEWFKVAQMIKQGTGFDDIIITAYNELGHYYADRFKWTKSAHYFQMAKNYKGLSEAYYKAEDYENLEKLVDRIPDGHEDLLLELAEKFELIGLGESAVQCYERSGKIKQAIDCAVLLNQWHLAVDLATKHNLPQVEGLLSQYANQQLENNRKLEAAELYRRAQRNTEAAKILSKIGEDLVCREASPLVIKKLHVMAALEVESHKKRLFDATKTGQVTTLQTLDSLITSDINTSADKVLNNPWRGAEAWHYYILAQRQLYQQNYNYALKTSIRMADYELELGTKKVYSLIALAAFYAQNFQECSKAFVKLEGMEENSESDSNKYRELAVAIFSIHPPDEIKKIEKFPCPGKTCKEEVTEFETHCKMCGVNFQSCVASGRAIVVKEYYQCKFCRHKMIEGEIQKQELTNCALCHMPVTENKHKK